MKTVWQLVYKMVYENKNSNFWLFVWEYKKQESVFGRFFIEKFLVQLFIICCIWSLFFPQFVYDHY